MSLSFWCLILMLMRLRIWRITPASSMRLDTLVLLWVVRSMLESYLNSLMMNLQISSWKILLRIMHLNKKHLMGNLQEISKWIVKQQSPQRDSFFRNISIWIWREKMNIWINISRERGNTSMSIMKVLWMFWIWLHLWNFSLVINLLI